MAILDLRSSILEMRATREQVMERLSKSAETTDPIDLAYCRATLYSALALGFRPPTEAAIARLVEPENAAALADAAAILDSHKKLGLVATVKILSQTGQIGVAALASSYRNLFGHTARGPVPPYETEYGKEALFQQPQELGGLMGFYRAFGLTVNFAEHERPDHISCECEFLSFLNLKEAHALEHTDVAMLEQTRKAEQLFLKDHLGRFLPTFATKLNREDRSGFYAALAQLCMRFVGSESGRLNVTFGGTNLALRPAEDNRVPLACGNGTECAAMPGAYVPEGSDSI
jgi:DMSO reductase family type II enzyme chaperone